MVDFPVRITGNVDETALLGGGFVKPMDRDDGEELFECPVIDEGLENTEVTKVLAAELFLKFSNFLGWGAAILVQGRNFGDQMPKGVFDAGFGGEVEKTKVESGGGLFLDGQAVVKRFAAIFAGKIYDKVRKLANELGIFLLGLNEGTGSFLDRAKTSTKRTEWWATVARPLSLTSVGWGTFSCRQTSATERTTSRAYSAKV